MPGAWGNCEECLGFGILMSGTLCPRCEGTGNKLLVLKQEATTSIRQSRLQAALERQRLMDELDRKEEHGRN